MMSNTDITIKLYPMPNPKVANSTTRFATAVVEEETGGKKVYKEKLAAVSPELPVCKFELNTNINKWEFVQQTDNGTPLTVTGKPVSPYIPSPDLIELVRLAQIIQRPVLIKGEPGSGKTQLARSVAFEWYGENYKNHFFEWTVKSTSKALDGLYSFDHLARLRDAQLSKSDAIPNGGEPDKRKYRSFGPMGKAFLTSTAANPSILLIDEIDKADIDFPNDLLLELDERRFTIPASETGELIEAEYPPIIFITSNDERELPEAFLRRCLFMYVKFPEDTLTDIIRAHMPDLVGDHPDFVARAVARFMELRKAIEADPADNKRVSTSELLDWLQAYNYDLKSGSEVDAIKLDTLPLYHQALLKTYAAINREKTAQKTSA